jgi:tetratricopeptide (TPR) repeat protein/CHAT domain-containing protein
MVSRRFIGTLGLALGAVLAVLYHACAAADTTNLADLKNLLQKRVDEGAFLEALPLAEKALSLAEQVDEAQRTNVASCLVDLAGVYEGLGRFSQSEQYYQRAFDLLHSLGLTNDLEFAGVAAGLGSLYIQTSQLEKAEPLLLQTLQLRTRLLPAGHADIGTSESFLGWLYTKRADYLRAELHYQKALEIRRQVLGPNDAGTAWSYNDLALLYHEMGDFARAEPLYLEALRIREQILSPIHPDLARSYNDLARFYYRMADYFKAEEFYRRALGIKEKILGPDDPSLALTLSNFGTFYTKIGDYLNAEPLLLRALAIKRKALKPDHPSLATAYHNLGVLYGYAGDLDLAKAYFVRDVEICERALGTNHTELAISLHSLGAILHQQRQYPEAESAYRRGLSIQEKVLPPEHPSIANSLQDLARLYADTGDSGRAEPLFRRALGIREKVFGPNHPDTANSLEGLARLKLAAGERPEAVSLAHRAAEAQQATLAMMLSFTSEGQRLAFRRTSDPDSLLANIGEPGPIALAVLRHKGVVLDSMLEDHLLATATGDPQIRALRDRLRVAQQALFDCVLAPAPDTRPEQVDERAAKRAKLTVELDGAEAALARHFAARGQARRALATRIEDVQKAIPGGAVLLEFLRYARFLEKGKLEQRYGVVLIVSRGDLTWIDLGPAESIDGQVRLVQNLMRGASDETALVKALRGLHQWLWTPIEAHLPRGTRSAIVSPDGELNLLSFAMLLDDSERFLAETWSIRYVATGRDLLSTSVGPSLAERRLAIYANPDFGTSLWSSDTNRETSLSAPSAEGRALRGLIFRPLPGADREARLLQQQASQLGFQEVSVHVGRTATKSELLRVRNPYVLHLATHGFLLPDQLSASSSDSGVGILGQPGRISQPISPMRRSGLALAGAQQTLSAWTRGQPVPPENDGIVSAEEVAGLDLQNTWLVVVSACDTGGGEVRVGEGVLGLRRGFVLAGARNLLLSLWPIDDERTPALILDFYGAACKSRDPSAALGQVQRVWLQRLKAEKGLIEACRVAGPFILSARDRTTP